MYSCQKKVTLNSVSSLFVTLALVSTVYILNTQICFADATATGAASKQGSVEITIKEGKISADINKAPLKSVLAKLEKECGISYTADKKAINREVSVKFDDMPLEKGINKILSPLSCLVVYGENEKLKKIFIFDVHLDEAVALGPGKSGEAGASVESKPLPQYTPHEVTSGPFFERPSDYKPLPEYTPHEITSGPFFERPPGYKPLPPFTPREVTGDMFTTPPREGTGETADETDSGG